MNRMDINVALFCCDGLFQRDLMWRLYDAFRLQAIVLQIDRGASVNRWQRLRRYSNLKLLGEYLLARYKRKSYNLRAEPIVRSMFFRNGQFPIFPPGVPIIKVDNINNTHTEEVLDQF